MARSLPSRQIHWDMSGIGSNTRPRTRWDVLPCQKPRSIIVYINYHYTGMPVEHWSLAQALYNGHGDWMAAMLAALPLSARICNRLLSIFLQIWAFSPALCKATWSRQLYLPMLQRLHLLLIFRQMEQRIVRVPM